LLYEGLKHYFVIRFAQRAGSLLEFLDAVLGPGDDIVHFEYSKKNSREKGPALIGIELQNKNDIEGLFHRMGKMKIVYEYLNNKPDLLQYLV
jgi:threonine dehydratase